MNANEIVNVLRACGNGNSVCEKCPFYIREDSNECRFNAIYESADIIEAQQQEIDRLKAIITDTIAEIDAIEMSDDTGISDGLYTAMRDAIELDVTVDSPGEVRQRLKADLYDKVVQIQALTADKDEQAGRIMELEELAKDLYFAYSNKDADCPHSFETKAVERYHALLGGGEDGSGKDE